MKRVMIIVGLVATLAIPTAAFAAGHRAEHRFGSTATAPKTGARGSAHRSGVTVALRPSKSVLASTKTKASAKPKARTRSGRKPKTTASGGKASSTVKVKRNRTVGTPGIRVTVGQRGGTAASGTPGTGGIAIPTSLNGISV
jgi:hypothetical protein